MGGSIFTGGAQPQQLLVPPNLLHPEISLGQGSGFVHNHGPNPAHGLHGRAVLKEDTLLAPRTDSGEEGQGHAEHQRAGAAHYQEGQGRVHPVFPVPGDQGGPDGRCGGDAHHHGGVNPGKPGDKPVDFGLPGGSALHAAQNPRDHGLLQGLLYPDGKLTLGVDTAGNHTVPRLHGHGHRLTGDGSGVQTAFPGDHHRIQGNPVSRPHQQHIAHPGLLRGNDRPVLPVQQGDRLRPQVHRLHNLAAAALHRPVLEKLTHPVEQHNPHALGGIADAKRADGRGGHEEILIQYPAPEQAPHCLPRDFPAQHHQSRQEKAGAPPAAGYPA